jgi:hypothetical protein
MPLGNNITTEQQQHLLETAMQTPEGRLFVAQKLMEPIKQERDYVSMGRQGFIPDQLAQGDVPYYDSDIKTRAVILPNRGEIPQERVNSQRVEVPIFPLASYPMVSIADTKLRRFNIIERVQTKARADLAEEEDRLIFGDLITQDYSKTTYGGQNSEARGTYTLANSQVGGVSVYRYATPESGDSWYSAGAFATNHGEDIFDHKVNEVTVSDNGITREFLVGLYGSVLEHDILPDVFLMHPRDYLDIFTWGRDDLDPEGQKEVRQTGRMGSIWGVEIHTSKIVPKGTVYCRAADEYLGVMPILIDLDVMDAPDPRGLAYGWAFYEYIGLAILNCWGISRGKVTRTAA